MANSASVVGGVLQNITVPSNEANNLLASAVSLALDSLLLINLISIEQKIPELDYRSKIIKKCKKYQEIILSNKSKSKTNGETVIKSQSKVQKKSSNTVNKKIKNESKKTQAELQKQLGEIGNLYRILEKENVNKQQLSSQEGKNLKQKNKILQLQLDRSYREKDSWNETRRTLERKIEKKNQFIQQQEQYIQDLDAYNRAKFGQQGPTRSLKQEEVLNREQNLQTAQKLSRLVKVLLVSLGILLAAITFYYLKPQWTLFFHTILGKNNWNFPEIRLS